MYPNTDQISNEFKDAPIPDRRNQRRLIKIAKAQLAQPEASYPNIAADDAELQGIYGFFSNPRIRPHDISEPHFKATVQRASQLPAVAVIHDTSTMKFKYDSQRPGLGYIGNNQRGFFLHHSLAIDPVSSRPLGSVAYKTWSRPTKKKRRKKKATCGAEHAKTPFKQKESYRWIEQVEQVENCFDTDQTLIHVMDQECDNYGIVGRLVKAKRKFVIRVHYNRNAKRSEEEEQWNKLEDLLEEFAFVYESEVAVSRRKPKGAPKSRGVARVKRKAVLEVSVGQVVLKRPSYGDKELPEQVLLNMVRVWEPNPPKGEKAVEWKLISTESIESSSEVGCIIGLYGDRWLIEEFFKALKTGCGYTKRELENEERLLKALAVSLPIAWLLLALRNFARTEAKAKAKEVVTERQLQVLSTISKKVEVTEKSTAVDVLYAIAGLGGHVSWNGEPGWIVLGRGLEKLLIAEQGFVAALSLLNEGKIRLR